MTITNKSNIIFFNTIIPFATHMLIFLNTNEILRNSEKECNRVERYGKTLHPVTEQFIFVMFKSNPEIVLKVGKL